MAICLVLLGLMTSFGLSFAEARDNQACEKSTTEDLEHIQFAMDQFVANNGRYPLPASRQLGRNHSAYGRSVGLPTDSAIHRIAQSSPILIGALPHATLGLPTQMASDCWGNQYTYAVTQDFTNTSGYEDPGKTGGVQLRTGTLTHWQTLSTRAAYTVLSHGRDALGASPGSHTGAPITCNAAHGDASVTRIDKENCDTNNSIFFTSNRNESDGDMFFDDYVMYAERPDPSDDCAESTITWGGHCSGNALLTLAGLAVNVTNVAAGYTGLALSTCNAGVRTTIGVCLPLGACIVPSPRNGNPMAMLTGTTMNFGTGVCETYKCCSGGVTISPLSPCSLPLDLPGLALCF